jgi:hypothetical protein
VGQEKANKEEARGTFLVPVALALLGLTLVGALQFSPKASDRDFAAVFAPGMSFEEAASRIHSAGAAVLSVGASENIIIARLPVGTERDVLTEAGAWLLLTVRQNSYCSNREAKATLAFQRLS